MRQKTFVNIQSRHTFIGIEYFKVHDMISILFRVACVRNLGVRLELIWPLCVTVYRDLHRELRPEDKAFRTSSSQEIFSLCVD